MADMDQQRRDALKAAGIMLVAGAPLQSAAVSAPSTTSGTQATIRAWQIGEQKGLGSLSLAESSAPRAGAGEVVVATRATALNHRDLAILAGRYGPPKPPQRVPVGDGAGVIVETGPGVTGWRIGDRVTAPHFTL